MSRIVDLLPILSIKSNHKKQSQRWCYYNKPHNTHRDNNNEQNARQIFADLCLKLKTIFLLFPFFILFFFQNPFLSVSFYCALFIHSRSKVSLPSSTLPLYFDYSSSSFCFLFHIYFLFSIRGLFLHHQFCSICPEATCFNPWS